MNRFLSLLCFLLVSLAKAQNTTDSWSGCVFPGQPNRTTDVKIGEPTPICITVGPGGSWAAGVPYVRWVFTPLADQYSYFRIPDSFNDLVNANRTGLEGKNLTVHTASQDFLSFLRVYYDPEDDRVFPFLTAIVDVDKGRVKGIAWDNSCVFCSPDRCLENTYDFDGNLRLDLGSQSKGCYVGKRECDVLHQNKSDSCNEFGQCFEEGCNCDSECDIRVFVVWTGTDIDNNVFQSSASRFSAFPAQNIQDRIKQNLPDLPDLSDINPFDRREKE